jgi:hypothetical protein
MVQTYDAQLKKERMYGWVSTFLDFCLHISAKMQMQLS